MELKRRKIYWRSENLWCRNRDQVLKMFSSMWWCRSEGFLLVSWSQVLQGVLSGGRTVLLVSHQLDLVKNADHIIFMKNGAIAEEGTHEQLMAMKGHYYSWKEEEFSKHGWEKLFKSTFNVFTWTVVVVLGRSSCRCSFSLFVTSSGVKMSPDTNITDMKEKK